jgi:hypothetical protein
MARLMPEQAQRDARAGRFRDVHEDALEVVEWSGIVVLEESDKRTATQTPARVNQRLFPDTTQQHCQFS